VGKHHERLPHVWPTSMMRSMEFDIARHISTNREQSSTPMARDRSRSGVRTFDLPR
jgi:hypothetical protein